MTGMPSPFIETPMRSGVACWDGKNPRSTRHRCPRTDLIVVGVITIAGFQMEPSLPARHDAAGQEHVRSVAAGGAVRAFDPNAAMESRDRGKYVPGMRICKAGPATQLRRTVQTTATDLAGGLLAAAGPGSGSGTRQPAGPCAANNRSGSSGLVSLLTGKENEQIIDTKGSTRAWEPPRRELSWLSSPAGPESIPSMG